MEGLVLYSNLMVLFIIGRPHIKHFAALLAAVPHSTNPSTPVPSTLDVPTGRAVADVVGAAGVVTVVGVAGGPAEVATMASYFFNCAAGDFCLGFLPS